MNRGIAYRPLSAVALLLACSTPVHATSMALSGSLLEPPPCTINGGSVIDVDFGNRVGVNRVDGVNYLQRVNYSLSCTPDANPWLLQLSVNGRAAGYDAAVLQTNKAGLGIKVWQNGRAFALGTPIPIDPISLPRIEVVPVKAPGAALTEGAFEALATLTAEYQ